MIGDATWFSRDSTPPPSPLPEASERGSITWREVAMWRRLSLRRRVSP